MSEILSQVTNAFAEAFGGPPDLVARAPGRVNLIGEHTDYNDGFVLPAAISRHSLIAARRRAGGQINVIASGMGSALSSFTIDELIERDPLQPWSDYVRGMIAAMQAAGHPLCGADIAIAGNIPQGSGLSSSASLCVGIGTAMAALSGITVAPSDLALLAQASENDFVGMKCGNMDQLASANGKAGHALLIDCRTLACEPVPIPEELAILIIHSGVTRGLVEGHYNQRRAQCEQAASGLGVTALRDATPAMLEAAQGHLAPEVRDRARHVISENARTLAAARALAAGDLELLGRLMAESHTSMRDHFCITVPPVDALVEEIHALIGGFGGARMTGGGFGGAVVAVLPRERVTTVTGRLSYRTPDGLTPQILVEKPSAGACIL